MGQVPELNLEPIGKEHGLSHSNTTSITQDLLGYIWIGTRDGLNKYDGNQIEVYKNIHQDTASLPNNYIRCLFTDSDGIVWVGTDDGLCYFNPDYNNFIRVNIDFNTDKIDLFRINEIIENPEGNILFAHENTIYEYKKQDNQKAHFVLNIPQGDITSFLIDQEKNLWVGALNNGGIFVYDSAYAPIKSYTYNPDQSNSLRSNAVYDLAIRNNKLWIAAEGAGISRLDIESNTFKHYNFHSYYEHFSQFVYVDKQNRLWTGDYTGIKTYMPDEDRFYQYYTDLNKPNSIRHNAFAVFQDNQDNYWVLYNPGGIGKTIVNKGFKVFDNKEFETWHTQADNISAVEEDFQGNLWIANPYNGIDIFHWVNNKTYRFNHEYQKKNTLGNGATFDICADGTDMWIGSYNGGLQKLGKDLRTFKSYTHNPDEPYSIAGNDVRSIFVDDDGNIWLAVHGKGVDKLNKQSGLFKHYNEENSKLSNNWTWQVFEDSERNIWVASAYGLSKLKYGAENFETFYAHNDIPGSLSYSEITTVFEDSSKRLWVGTRSGLNLYNPEENNFRQIKGDLEDVFICAILDDDEQNLWITSQSGLYRYNPETEQIRQFDESDGLPTREFNERAAYKNMFNDLFFGSNRGVVIFNPSKLKFNTVKPEVVFTSLKLFGEEINEYGPDKIIDKHISRAKTINLHYDQKIISIEFKAINLIHPEKNQYAYMLEGFEDSWHFSGTRNEATYTNLNPGKYTFRVKASNNDLVWNNIGASINIIVQPPWYMTWWFILLAILFIVVLIISIYYIRTQQLLRQKQNLAKKVKKSTAELREKNQMLIHQAGEMNEINTLLEERQQEIMEQASRLQDLNTSKNRLFSVIAHDLTSPFNSILGFSELFYSNFNDLDDQEKIDMASNIYDSSRTLYGLLDNLLNWARSQTEQIKFKPEKVDIAQIIQDTIEIFKYRINRKKINIVLDINSKAKVWADIDMLKTIIRNLLSNAIKFSKPEGSIYINLSDEKNKVRFSIKDEGIGMEPEQVDKLFNLKKSVSVPGTDGERGSGIGLIITKDFIEKNQGKLHISASPGKGSEFSFSMPLK